jgi:hypothetical protein
MNSCKNPLHTVSVVDGDVRSYFSLLPTELLSLILQFYTNSFQGLIAFACLNERCQKIVNSSLLWLSCDLTFHVTKRYLQAIEVWKPNFVGNVRYFLKHDPAYINSCLSSPTLSVTLFDESSEGNFASNRYKSVPSAFTVTVQRLNCGFVYDSLRISDKIVLVQKVRTSFMRLFLKYHRLWYWHTRCRPFLDTIFAYVKRFILYPLIYLVITSLFSLFFCIFCLFSVSSSSPLSFYNHIGFLLLIANLFVLMVFLTGVLFVEIIKVYSNTYSYLYEPWSLVHVPTVSVIAVLISIGSLVGVILSYLQLADILYLEWWLIVLIMWFFYLVAAVVGIVELWSRSYSNFQKAQKIIMIYCCNAIPASCLLAALFLYPPLSFTNGLLILIPVFPLFILSILGSGQLSRYYKIRVDYYLDTTQNNEQYYGCCYSSLRATGILWLGRVIAVLPVTLCCCYFFLLISCSNLLLDPIPVLSFPSISPLISVLILICCFEVYFICCYYVEIFVDMDPFLS